MYCRHVNDEGVSDCYQYTRSTTGLCLPHLKIEKKMSSGKRKICIVDGCDILQQSPTGVCWKCRAPEKKMSVTLKECATPGCNVQTSSSTGYCKQDGCRQQRGRKVSTEGKAARGRTPDSGSIPDASTDNELLVLQEDMADMREETAELKKQLQQLRTELDQRIKYTYTYTPGGNPYQVTSSESWVNRR